MSQEQQITRLITAHSLNWKLLLDLGERHRVSGFLASSLRSQDAVPEDVRQILKRRAERIERDNLLQLALSVKVMRAMQRERIPFVIMKGIPLAQILHGNVAARHSKDIDLLVNNTDVPAARALLLRNGFEASAGLGGELTPRQARSWEQHRKNHDYKHVATGTQLELHWRAFDNVRLGTALVEKVDWVECSPGMRLPTLRREDLFPVLCAHGAGHAWFRLKWLVDVAAFLAQSSPEEQQNLLRSAHDRGLDRPTEQAILLSRSLFHDHRIEQPRNSTTIGRWLATVGRDALLQEIPSAAANAEFVPRRLALSKLFLRRGWSYRWEEIKVYMTSPADWKAVRLPDWLHFAYPLVRLPLWLRRQRERRRRV